MCILQADGLRFSYDGKKEILRGLDLRLEPGRMYAVTGPSGCGKTTFLSLLGGLDTPSAGSVLYRGADIAAMGLPRYRREHVAFVFQNYNLIEYLTPLENAQLLARRPAMPILERLGLSRDEVLRRTSALSGGQRQRVALARALARDSDVLLADEPTGSVDAAAADEITNILKDCARSFGKCVVIVTHSSRLASEADEILGLRKGLIVRRVGTRR